ncbi:WD40 repeat domain-containing protein [Candidatus Saccharibacteria bacterium]|nr:WD40 repeat domain-containing protein [Candidatus Saccharibacteria bacterium]MCL1962913.1 WD40 repeat domain-containing protein [Candidatus Saccharibacteria bacterium]
MTKINIKKVFASVALVGMLGFAGLLNMFGVAQAVAGDNVVLQWNKNFGGSSAENFESIILTSDGGYIAAGSSYSTDGDLTGLNKGSNDAIIVKYNPAGATEWNKNFGGSGDDRFYSIAQTPDGGYIVAGCSNSTNDDLTGLNKGSYDAIIVKYDSNGEIEWNKNFGGSSWDQFQSVAITSDGGYIATGFSRSTNGDLTGLNKGDYDATIVKYDPSGVIEWNKNFGGSRVEYFYSIAQVSDGGYIATGFSNSTNGDLIGLNKGDYDATIVKYDPSGVIEWNKNFGGSDSDGFNSIAPTPDGGYIAVGNSESTNSDLTGLNKGGYDAIIAKYSSTGTLEWNKNFGGNYNDNFNSIAPTPDGGYIVAGRSYSTDGDLTGLNKGDRDAIIAKYSSTGTLEWNKNFGGSDSDEFFSIAPTPDGGYVAVGYSRSTDGDLIGLNKGSTDFIIVKYLDTSEPVIVVPPLIEPDTPNGSAGATGCDPVKVTLKTNVPIVIPNGWTKADGLTYTKTYTRNTTEIVPMVGLNGVVGENVEIVIDTITCRPTNPITPPNTGLSVVQIGGLLVAGLATIAVAVILARRLSGMIVK